MNVLKGEMKILHICWGLEKTNGAANIARLVMGEQQADGHAVEFVSRPIWRQLRTADQIWCHCGWYWMFWLIALYRLIFHRQPSTSNRSPFLYRMTECCYDPIRLRYHGWKKRLVAPFERWSLRQCDVLVATCEAEAKWNCDYVGKKCPKVEIIDVKRFFNLSKPVEVRRKNGGGLNILYLGRPHPLKGTRYLEQAVKELNLQSSPSPSPFAYNLRLVSDHFGEELERDWQWCDVLCLPTLSENFGLVVAEALSRGVPVITTDGAAAWKMQPGVTYLSGYCAGSDEQRVGMLVGALRKHARREA